jgi:probable F420-dependent oxidoreductase
MVIRVHAMGVTSSSGLREQVRSIEEAGMDGVFVADHLFVSRGGPRREALGGGDPFVRLAVVGALSERLMLGSSVVNIGFAHPALAIRSFIELATLVGGERVLAGIGAGWNREEMRNHGTDPRTRMALMRERVEAMKAIWTQEEASYAGEHVAFERIWSHPKPAQRPHPPVLVGGLGPTVLDRVLAFGDGWLPTYVADDRFFERLAELRARAERPISVHILGMPADPHALERVRDAGAQRAMQWLPPGSRSTVEAALERWEAAIAELNGE